MNRGVHTIFLVIVDIGSEHRIIGYYDDKKDAIAALEAANGDGVVVDVLEVKRKGAVT